MKLIVTTDGSCTPNPGAITVGILITTEENEVVKYLSRSGGVGTNNQAEYMAATVGVEHALAQQPPPSHIELHVDSQLLCKQLNFEWEVRDKALRAQRDALVAKLRAAEVEFTVVWAQRTEGARPIADALSKGKLVRARELMSARYSKVPTSFVAFNEGPLLGNPDEEDEVEGVIINEFIDYRAHAPKQNREGLSD